MIKIFDAHQSARRYMCLLAPAILVCPLLSACGASVFTDPKTNPAIHMTTTNYMKPFWEDQSVDVLAVTASRRMVIVKEGRHGSIVETCAEPPPDVGEAFSDAIAAGLQGAVSAAKGDDTRIGASIAGQYAHAIATQIAPLLYRSQGLQALRDSQYALCVDRMSGYITDEVEYLKAKKYRFDEAVKLIHDEIPVMQAAQSAFFEHWKTSGGKVDVDSAVRLMEAAKPTAPPIPTLPGASQ